MKSELKLTEQFKLAPVALEGASRGRLRVIASCPGEDGAINCMVGDSVGRVEIWSFNASKKLSSENFKFVRTVDTQVRLTGGLLWTAIADAKAPTSRKRKPKAPLTK